MEAVKNMFKNTSQGVRKYRGGKKKVELVYGVVTPGVKESVKRLAKAMGISVSEYVRRLILEDLDRRTLFTTQLKEAKT
jgi:hypothetical protein